MIISEALAIIEQKTGLHEQVLIIYIVSGYQCSFSTQNGDREIYTTEGETLEEALVAMAEKLQHFSKDEYWRSQT